MSRRGTLPFALLALLLPSASQAAKRTCGEWDAVYVSQIEEDGSRVMAEFGKAEGSEPVVFTLTGFGKTNRKTWQHKTKAWCFQGSGGCHVGLRMKGQKLDDIEFEQSLRILFVRSSRTDTEGTPDILVLSGLRFAFLESARETGSIGLAIETFSGAPETILPPDAFYFERCRVNR